jgi:hypothetical protein
MFLEQIELNNKKSHTPYFECFRDIGAYIMFVAAIWAVSAVYVTVSEKLCHTIRADSSMLSLWQDL